MHIVRNKVSLQDNNRCKFDIPITLQHNRLDYVTINIVKPGCRIPASYNLVQVNHALEAHEKFLHASPFILNATSTSNEIVNMPFIPSTRYDYGICLICKIKKMQPASSKQRKFEH